MTQINRLRRGGFWHLRHPPHDANGLKSQLMIFQHTIHNTIKISQISCVDSIWRKSKDNSTTCVPRMWELCSIALIFVQV